MDLNRYPNSIRSRAYCDGLPAGDRVSDVAVQIGGQTLYEEGPTLLLTIHWPEGPVQKVELQLSAPVACEVIARLARGLVGWELLAKPGGAHGAE